MIQLKNIEKCYETRAGKNYVLRQINLDIAEGEFITIMGPSAAGKTTLLNILGMLDSAWEGEYYLFEHAVHAPDLGEQPTPIRHQMHRLRVRVRVSLVESGCLNLHVRGLVIDDGGIEEFLVRPPVVAHEERDDRGGGRDAQGIHYRPAAVTNQVARSGLHEDAAGNGRGFAFGHDTPPARAGRSAAQCTAGSPAAGKPDQWFSPAGGEPAAHQGPARVSRACSDDSEYLIAHAGCVVKVGARAPKTYSHLPVVT